MTVAEQDIAKADEEFGRELSKNAGNWVAIRDQGIVAAASSAQALLEQVETQEIDAIFRVPESQRAALL